MHILLVYATYSNSTALASEHLVAQLRVAGHEVSLIQAADVTEEQFATAEAIVLASPSWDYNGQQGMPHEDFESMQARLADLQLTGKLTAVVALGDSSFTYFCGAADHLSRWLSEKGGIEALAPLKIDGYYSDEDKARGQIEAWSSELLTALAG